MSSKIIFFEYNLFSEKLVSSIKAEERRDSKDIFQQLKA